MKASQIDATDSRLQCTHCGDPCIDEEVVFEESVFCCQGCKMVYQLLKDNGLSSYYDFESNPGISQYNKEQSQFDFLDNEELVGQLLLFRDGGLAKIKLHLPQIHCSSCLWLLENISKLNPGIVNSKVNFTAKEASIVFDESITSLRSIAELLTKIGYEPRINYDKLDQQKPKSNYNKRLLMQLGTAGFAFGNIMLLSFPEYLGFDKASYLFHIGYINILLAIPVLLYCGIDYLKNAVTGLKMGNLNIDIPIAIGMITLFGRSVYEIVSHQGEGYLDSFSGFVFFLLIGKWFQSYTNQALDFDRNYKSYFPISATVKKGNDWITKSIDKLMPGDILRIKNLELIPTDAVLHKGKARIDYSFVTGEADHISKVSGEALFAGGRHQGESIEVLVTHKVDQSYLTQLWSDETFDHKQESTSSRMISFISKYFTIVVLLIAVATMVYWWFANPDIAFTTFTSVLIVACPCALALAIPFTYGNVLRLVTSDGLYLRNVSTIENMQDVIHIIFDKTGTLTDNNKVNISYHGVPLTEQQQSLIRSACSHSSHPLSKGIVNYFDKIELIDIDAYEDVIGKGLIAKWDNHRLRLGSSAFIFDTEDKKRERGVFIEIDNVYIGYFQFVHAFRDNIESIVAGLQSDFKVSILSGDTDHEIDRIQTLFGTEAKSYFQQSPQQKLDMIKSFQAQGDNVMMIGDGLNDAGALKQSNVGIVISDAVNNFSPACDGILDANRFANLLRYVRFLRAARIIIYGAFILAFLYNSIGLYFAISGRLSPVIAAILMPLSSISVIIYGVVSSYFVYRYFFYQSSKYGAATNVMN